MGNIIKFFKYFSIPVILIAIGTAIPAYMAWKEFKIQEMLVDQALQGNRPAIQILVKYEKPWKLDEKVVYEAIKGNQYALEVLKIND